MRASRICIRGALFVWIDQSLLFLPGHLFYLVLPAHRLFLCTKFFIVYQSDRAPVFCIFRAFSAVMRADSLFQIIGPAGIESPVAAFHNIRIVHNYSLRYVLYPIP